MFTLNAGLAHRLRDVRPHMTATQRRLCDYLLGHPVDVSYMSLKELSVRANISEVSILSFCRLVGFDSYISMREAFRDCIRGHMEQNGGGLLCQCDSAALSLYYDATMRSHYEILANLEFETLDRCARTLLDSQSVFVMGHDVSKIAADYLSSRLNYLHIRSQSVNLGDRDTVQVLVSNLRPHDCVVVFSFPPYYNPGGEVVEGVRERGATLITVADSGESPVVSEDGIFVACRTRNPYFFNWMSVPIHFSEILVYHISTLMGEKGEDIIRGFNALGNY